MLVSGALLAQVSTSTKVLSFVGARRFNPGKPADAPFNQVVQGPDVDVSFDIPGISGNNSPARLPANFVPRPTGNSFASATFNGFKGLDQFSQAVAPTGFAGGDNGQLEPPDHGLAIGNGFVLEPINPLSALKRSVFSSACRPRSSSITPQNNNLFRENEVEVQHVARQHRNHGNHFS